MPECPHCGADAAPDKKFCTKCGKPLQPAAEPAPAQTPETPPPPPPQDAPQSPGPEPLQPQATEPDTPAPEPEQPPQQEEPAEQQPAPVAAETVPPLFRAPEKDPDKPAGPIEKPEFGVRVREGVLGPDDLQATDEPAGPQSLFERRPELVGKICYGCLISIVAVLALALGARLLHRSNQPPVQVSSSAQQTAAAAQNCDATVSKRLGQADFQTRVGKPMSPADPGLCIPSGSLVSTQPDSRLHIRLKKQQADLFINSRTQIRLTYDEKETHINLTQGEIWLTAKAAHQWNVSLPESEAAARSPGEFHFLYRNSAQYVTNVTGAMAVAAGNKKIRLAPGEQFSSTSKMPAPKTEPIKVAKFRDWVSAWKDNFAPPTPKTAKKPAPGQKGKSEPEPEQPKVDHDKLMAQAVRDAFEFRDLPDFVDVLPDRRTERWGLVILKDGRPDADQHEDYRRPTPLLMRFMDGHWEFLEEFQDYDRRTFRRWAMDYGFTEKDAEDLQLE